MREVVVGELLEVLWSVVDMLAELPKDEEEGAFRSVICNLLHESVEFD